jgi:hypothetical protein
VTEIRPDVVSALVRGHWFDAAKAEPTTAELGAAGDALGELAKSELQAATGHLPPETTVYDLTLDELEILAALWAVVGRWKAAPEIGGQRRLGDALKILPAWVVADVLRILAIGKYIPWSDVPEPPPCDG